MATDKKDNRDAGVEEFELKISPTAFNMEGNRSSLNTRPARYSKQVAEVASAVEELDRYDDFSALRLDTDSYRREGRGVYGIPFDPAVHKGGAVIQPHQRKAAEDFLKRLRGFGMLADVVGSGKTFEACVVLSELAVRGAVKSALIVAPVQVYDAWKKTLEVFFGLGKGALCEVKSLSDKRAGLDYVFDSKGRMSPTRPLLVKWNDFTEWTEDDVRGVLFDVIIVDEAHHLSDQTGDDANAMKLLSVMMQNKKAANKEFCLLLSATPHDGNLENMFPLWYFIDSKGGLPEDFGRNMADSARSELYRRSKERYINYICHGATTVMEFINRVKYEEVTKLARPAFDKFVSYRFTGTAEQKKERFEALSNGEKYSLVQKFLDEEDNAEIRKAVNKNVALAYHEGILRQIMIRQPNTFRLKRKIVKNYYFYPVTSVEREIKLNLFDGNYRLDLSRVDGDEAVVCADGKKLSTEKLIEGYSRAKFNGLYSPYQGQYEIIGATVNAMGGFKEELGYRRNSEGYYLEQLLALTAYTGRYEITNYVEPVSYAESSFARKFKKALEILRLHQNRRVLVFFDYDRDRDKNLKNDYSYTYENNDVNICLADKFLAELKKLPEFAGRILDADELYGDTGETLEKRFAEKEDAILVVTASSLTEGANLQSCNVIINFQITPDPLSMDQRIGRVFRIRQENDVSIYSLADMNVLEGYVLAYFTRIGLMTSNSGDATIISGSNNEHMVTVRCKNCKKVRLFTLEDYNKFKEEDGEELKCRDTDACRHERGGYTVMREMNVHDFQCSTCKTTFSRSMATEGYKCVYDGGSSMCSTGREDDRDVYCRKICAMSHCPKFDKGGELEACPALAAYRENGNIGDQDLMEKCATCPLRKNCPQKCRVGQFVESVEACVSCLERKRYGRLSLCRPHVLKFDSRWEAPCPRCASEKRNGKIRPILARTFAAFIKGLWSYSKKRDDDNFCEILSGESQKVAEIQDILSMDKPAEEV